MVADDGVILEVPHMESSLFEDILGSASSCSGNCSRCGWQYSFWFGGSSAEYGAHHRGAVLRQFPINAEDVALNELGAHLRRRYSDVYSLSPRRFEELIDDAFKALGHRTILTQPSKDGGADLILLSSNGREVSGIVECKRNAEARKVDVSIVRQVVGASIFWEAQCAFIVTSSAFTREAIRLSSSFRRQGFPIDLICADKLLRMLEVYNLALPPLPEIDASSENRE